MKTIAIHFARLGPYHLARLESAVEVLGPRGWEVVALETAGADATYEWERTGSEGAGYPRRTVFADRVFEKIPAGELRRGMWRVLDELKPEAVAVAGWGTADARACLAWCERNGARAIVMSETRAADGRRVWWKEWVKGRVVRRFDGALCGGESHRRYLVGLGMRGDRIALGYNVVDNQFFAKDGEERKAERGNAEMLKGEQRGAWEGKAEHPRDSARDNGHPGGEGSRTGDCRRQPRRGEMSGSERVNIVERVGWEANRSEAEQTLKSEKLKGEERGAWSGEHGADPPLRFATPAGQGGGAEKAEHPRDSAELKGKTNVWPREGTQAARVAARETAVGSPAGVRRVGTSESTFRSEAEQKLKEELTTIEHQGGCEMEQPEVGPKGEGVASCSESYTARRGTPESNCTESTEEGVEKAESGNAEKLKEGHEVADGGELIAEDGSQRSELAEESKIADSPVFESPTRSASGPASLPVTSYSPLATAPEALGPYFLASNRFVERKNLGRLIEAYAGYCAACAAQELEDGRSEIGESGERGAGNLEQGAGGGVWPLVLLGDGELRGELEEKAERLKLRIAEMGEAGSLERGAWSVERGVGLEEKADPDGICDAFHRARKLKGDLTSDCTENTEDQFVQKQGSAWASQAGAAFSNPSTSELARDSENTSPISSAVGPASLDSGRSSLDSADEGGLVVFAGFRQIGELRGFYAGAGAFVHPALAEPWGLVINEAMASGLPVLSSRNVGAAEELVVEGETGFLFDPLDVGGIAGLMGRVAGMPVGEREAMGRAARAEVERRAPKRAFGEGLAGLLEDVG
jgi:glycosyltransferase involved in cell wall biosynthesis